MKRISLFVIAVTLIPTLVGAFNEPEGFMGLKFGRPVAEGRLPQCQRDNIQRGNPSPANSTRAGLEKLMASNEAKRRELSADLERAREEYYLGKASRNDMLKAEQALTEAMLRVDEDRQLQCWEQVGTDSNAHTLKNVIIGAGGSILDVNTKSIDGKLAHVFIVFPQSDYGQIYLTFKERYGPPTSVKSETVQSGIGAKFKNEIFKWEGRRVTITLNKMGYNVVKGTVDYDTDIWRAQSAQKLQQEIKKAAKGL